MRLLKQSTSVDLPIGPFVDSTDGFTAETGLTLTQPDIRLKKNGGAWAQKAAAQTLTHEEAGWYEVTLDATDTDTLGQLQLAVAETGALPVWCEFMVMPANVWDSLFGADLLQVDVTQLLGVGQSATDLKDFADDGYDPATNKVQGVVLTDTVTTYTGNTPQTGDVFPLASTEIADIKAKTDNLPSDPADASVVAGLIAAVEAKVDIVDTVVDAILVDTAEIGAAGAGLTVLATQASVNTIDDFLDTEVAAIKAKTDSLTFTVANQVDANTLAIANGAITAAAIATNAIDDDALAADAVTAIQSGLATAAALTVVDDFLDTEVAAIKVVTDNLARSAKTIVQVTVDAGSSTTSVITSALDPAAAVADQFKGRILIFAKDTTTTNLRGQATDITASTSGGVLTVTALTTAPVSGDVGVIV